MDRWMDRLFVEGGEGGTYCLASCRIFASLNAGSKMEIPGVLRSC